MPKSWLHKWTITSSHTNFSGEIDVNTENYHFQMFHGTDPNQLVLHIYEWIKSARSEEGQVALQIPFLVDSFSWEG